MVHTTRRSVLTRVPIVPIPGPSDILPIGGSVGCDLSLVVIDGISDRIIARGIDVLVTVKDSVLVCANGGSAE